MVIYVIGKLLTPDEASQLLPTTHLPLFDFPSPVHSPILSHLPNLRYSFSPHLSPFDASDIAMVSISPVCSCRCSNTGRKITASTTTVTNVALSAVS